jgi:hypothetical protein
MLGRWGDDVDLQDNMYLGLPFVRVTTLTVFRPGNRPQLDEPNPEDFSFEPQDLKKILTLNQQHQILEEMKDAASNTASPAGGILNMKKTVAAFYVFRCYRVYTMVTDGF